MNFDDYQVAANSTRLPTADAAYIMANLPSEVGELYGKFARELRDGTAYSDEDYAKELGDILWHVACLASDMGLSLQDVAELNVRKIMDRVSRGVVKGSGDDR